MPWRQAIDLSSFEPETVQILSEALEEAWKQIECNTTVANREAARLQLAKHIVEYASKGERDCPKLVEYAVYRATF